MSQYIANNCFDTQRQGDLDEQNSWDLAVF
jgi:hypothetical protein